MADTLTTVYQFTKPEVGGSDDTWGDKTNADWDKVDTLFASAFEGGTPTNAGTLKPSALPASPVLDFTVTGANPRFTLVESDQTAPAGRWRFIADNDALQLQHSTSGEFTAAETAWIARGSVPKSFDSNYLFRAVAGLQVISSELLHYPSGNALRLKDAADASGIATIFRTDSTSFYVVLTDSGDADGSINALRPFTVTKATGRVAMSNGAAINNGLTINNATSGLSFASQNAISVTNLAKHLDLNGGNYGFNTTSGQMNLVAGGAQVAQFTGASVVFHNAVQFNTTGTLAAAISPAGTASPAATTIITREKGDLRYAAASSQRYKEGITNADEIALAAAFDALQVRTWTWGGELPEEDERFGTAGVGFVVEELGFPAAVRQQWVEDAGGTMQPNSVAVDALIATLTAKVRALETRIAILEA